MWPLAVLTGSNRVAALAGFSHKKGMNVTWQFAREEKNLELVTKPASRLQVWSMFQSNTEQDQIPKGHTTDEI